jgi:hypothetical protein
VERSFFKKSFSALKIFTPNSLSRGILFGAQNLALNLKLFSILLLNKVKTIDVNRIINKKMTVEEVIEKRLRHRCFLMEKKCLHY